MTDERELVIHPIVPDSVRHNSQVHAQPFKVHVSNSQSEIVLTLSPPIGRFLHPVSHRLPLRYRRRHPRTRVLPRLPLLPLRHTRRQCAGVGSTG